jgi:hypothetical protein
LRPGTAADSRTDSSPRPCRPLRTGPCFWRRPPIVLRRCSR